MEHARHNHKVEVTCVEGDVVDHVADAVFNELDGAIALPVAAEPILTFALNCLFHFCLCHK